MPRYDVLVADTGALISLEKLARFDLLQEVCSTLLIPRAVLEELSQLEPAVDYLEASGLAAAVDCRVIDQDDVAGLEDLHYGERYAVALARAEACPILVEDQQARRRCQQEGLRFFGAAAAVKINFDRGALDQDEASTLLREFYTKRRINEGVLEALLAAIVRD